MQRFSSQIKRRIRETHRVINSNFHSNRHFNGIISSGFTNDGNGGRAVMGFGDGSHGALGLPAQLTGIGCDAYEPMRVPDLPSDVSAAAAGHYHSLAVTSGGELWAWGRNDEAQLGRGAASSRDTWNEPKRVQGLDQVKVCYAFASGVVSAAIGDDGSLWVWGKSKRGQLGLGKGITEALVPTKVEALAGEKIVKASFGWGHTLAQTEEGRVYGWGYVADGRIGSVGSPVETSPLDSYKRLRSSRQQISALNLEAAEKRVLEGIEKEKSMPIVWEPCLIEELQSIEVAEISCGLDHSLVLLCDGTLLSSGSNVYGQLGRKKQDLGLFPVDLTLPIISIAAGLGHSLAIYEETESSNKKTGIISWGWNRSSQLGRSGSAKQPALVEGLEGETVVSVSAGRVHSLALTDKGDLWVWGCGKGGRLGLGSSYDEAEPTLLEDFEGRILQAVAGFDHTLIVVVEAC